MLTSKEVGQNKVSTPSRGTFSQNGLGQSQQLQPTAKTPLTTMDTMGTMATM
jgi:hypothetical protein